MKRKLFFIIAFNLLVSTNSQIETLNRAKQIIINTNTIQMNYDFVYNNLIEDIKNHEGLKLHKYICPAGYPTIGYGHLIKENESFPELITIEFADSLLRSDLNKAIELVKNISPILTKPENELKLLAISHFVFAKGIGNYLSSDLKVLVDNQQSINEEIVKWCYYTKPNGSKVKNEKMYKNREMELSIYNL